MSMSVEIVGSTGSPYQRGRLRTVQRQRKMGWDQYHRDISEVAGTHSPEDSSPSLTESRGSQNPVKSSLGREVQVDGVETGSGTENCILRSLTYPHDLQSPASISNRRGIDLSIPQFHRLSNTHGVGFPGLDGTKSPTDHGSYRSSNRFSLIELPQSQDACQQLLRSQSLGPLTPPHDVDVLLLLECTLVGSPTEAEADSTDQTPARTDAAQSGKELSLSMSHNHLPKMQPDLQLPSQDASQHSWLDRALQSIDRPSGVQASSHYIEIASQVLPNHASDRRNVKTSELMCDHLQQTLVDLQGITITHAIAVPQSQVVEDFPKSPPTTPNFVVTNGYFDEPIIVTKAANVPLYHSIPKKNQDSGVQMQRRIMVRSVVDFALLERCIPPTTAGEIADFFNADSYRSYLADRLSELAIGTGSLLLIYPTRSGGQTFARRCIAPILDPLLREMSILRGLDTDAAQRLGSMEAIDAMMEFDEMKEKVQILCSSMSEKCQALSIRSSYKLVHSAAAQITLDRNTWMTWYVEQEQQRLKQNLVEYHKDGGRLPQGDGGSSELTAGMLTREIIEGLQKSKNGAGDAGIEVGVFVIRRVRRST